MRIRMHIFRLCICCSSCFIQLLQTPEFLLIFLFSSTNLVILFLFNLVCFEIEIFQDFWKKHRIIQIPSHKMPMNELRNNFLQDISAKRQIFQDFFLRFMKTGASEILGYVYFCRELWEIWNFYGLDCSFTRSCWRSVLGLPPHPTSINEPNVALKVNWWILIVDQLYCEFSEFIPWKFYHKFMGGWSFREH